MNRKQPMESKQNSTFHQCKNKTIDYLIETALSISQSKALLIRLYLKDDEVVLFSKGINYQESYFTDPLLDFRLSESQTIQHFKNKTKKKNYKDSSILIDFPSSFISTLPVTNENEDIIGGLVLINKSSITISQEQLNSLSNLAHHIKEIIELQHENESLRAKKQELELIKSFTDHTQEGIIVSEENGRLFYMNKKAAQRIGIETQEANHYFVKDFELIFKTSQDWLEHVERVKQQKSLGIEGVHYNHKNGNKTPVFVSVQHIVINKRSFILATSVDISDLKEIKKELNTTKDLLQETSKLGKIGGFVKDFITGEDYWSETTKEIHEVPTDFDPTMENGLQFYKEGKSRDTITKAANQAITFGKSYDVLVELISYKGNHKWVRVIGNTTFENDSCTRLFGTIQDVSQQTEQYIELQNTKNRLESILNEMEDVMWSTSADERTLLFVSPTAEKLYGYPLDDWYQQPGLWMKAIHPEDTSVIPKIHEDLKHTGKSRTEYRIISNDGTIKHVENRAKLVKHNGKIIRIDQMISDKTIEKKLEESLRLETRFQKVLLDISLNYINVDIEHVEDHIQASLNQIGLFVNADRAYIFDYFNQEKFFQNTYEWCQTGIVPQKEKLQHLPLSEIRSTYDVLIKGESLIVPNVQELPKEDETRKTLEAQDIKSAVIIPLIKNEKLIGCVGFDYVKDYHTNSHTEEEILLLFAQILMNIYEKNEQYHQIKRQEKKYKNIVSNIELGLMELNQDGKITYINPTLEEMCLYSNNELVGKSPVTTFLDDKDQKEQIFKWTISKPTKIKQEEVKIYTKTGAIRYWNVTLTPYLNEENQFIGSIALCYNMTDDKLRNIELKSAKEKAEIAALSKDVFLANMSHEIRTPLNIITGLVREFKKHNLNQEQYFYAEETLNASNHLLELVNNILDLSKIETGQLSLNHRPFSIQQLFDELRRMFHLQAENKGIELDFYISKNISKHHLGDAVRIKQVFINLIMNAIKFTHEGYITVQANKLKTQENRDLIEFRVSDSGVGIDTNFIHDIFEKFTQETNNYNRKFQGPGLGLTISKQLIELMNGVIKVESKKGKGTKIIFSIPLECTSDKQIIKKKKPTYNFKGKTVLLVEDNKMNRVIAKATINGTGCTILEANGGIPATQIIAKNSSIDLILMDIQMPDMDGAQTTKIIREQLLFKQPIIALTANAVKSDLEHYLKEGFNDYITKPFEEDVLLEKMANQLKLEESETAEVWSSKSSHQKITPQLRGELYDLKPLFEENDEDLLFIKEITEIFTALIQETIEKFDEHLNPLDRVKLAKAAHKIKPNLEIMGVEELFELIREINYNEEKVPADHLLISKTQKCITILDALKEELENINW